MATKWVKKEYLGGGSYGLVFRAECASPSSCNSTRTVAIKSSHKLYSESLRLERDVLYQLRGCKEIVHCFKEEDFDSVEDGKNVCNIVLEYANGGTLGQLLKSKGGWMPEYEASWCTFMLLKGLCYVHKRGYVHCDMKPDNVLVFNIPYGECKGMVKYNLKLADFGLAKKRGRISSLTFRCHLWYAAIIGGLTGGDDWEYKNRGTLRYSSPESVAFGVNEAALDVWSLGCIVLEMLLGEGGLWNRYLNVDIQCLAGMIRDYEDDRLSLLLPKFRNLSVNAKDFVRRCLTKNVAKRWTAKKLLKHPFITDNQNLLEILEAQFSYKKIKYQSNFPSRSTLVCPGVC